MPNAEVKNKGTGLWNKRCTATSRGTGNQCRQYALRGYKVCRFHGGKGLNSGGGKDITLHGRRASLSKVLGPRFVHLLEDANSLRDFHVDNALFLDREAELTGRLPEGDSVKYRKEARNLFSQIITSMRRETEFESLSAATQGKIANLGEHLETGVKHDEVSDEILTNAERRVKVATAAITALAKEENALTFKDMVSSLGRMVDIAIAEAGEEIAARIARRFECEVLGVITSVEGSPLAQTRALASRSAKHPSDRG